MSTRCRAKVVPLSTPASAARPLESMLMQQPGGGGLRVLLLALHGLEDATKVFDLNSEDVQRGVSPLIALTYDIQAALGRERARMRAAVAARGGEA